MEATGRVPSAKPDRARRTAREIAVTASVCPTTRSAISCSMFKSAELSSSLSCPTGTPVHCATTSATCDASTTVLTVLSFAEASCTMAPASSMTSIALSGRNRSVMYRVASLSAAGRASGAYVTPWCSSYVFFNPSRITSESSGEGSPMRTGWNRRSRAASFSMCFRYSSIVVAPMHCSSPRASAGFIKLPASIPPSSPVPPAPTSMWISSMNKIISPAVFTSSMTFLRRSSNSPRYFVLANSIPSCKLTTLLFFKRSGTSPATIRSASPSAIAVLPTPGSPTKHGLLLRRRTRMRKIRSTSASRPKTGSSFPALASAHKSMPHS
mmetsp:Transcript_5295/g.19829  ORF Transcript_5295/g.19829 Transcript_5295/m.19829 type:complete len:325 (-) Transcript_5295:594-1568(-)